MLSTDSLRLNAFLQAADPNAPCLWCALPNLDPQSAAPCAAATIAGCFAVAAHVTFLVHRALMGWPAGKPVFNWRESDLFGEGPIAWGPSRNVATVPSVGTTNGNDGRPEAETKYDRSALLFDALCGSPRHFRSHGGRNITTTPATEVRATAKINKVEHSAPGGSQRGRFSGTHHMLDALQPGPYAHLFSRALLVRVGLWFAVALLGFLWCQRRLQDSKQHALMQRLPGLTDAVRSAYTLAVASD